MSNHYPEELLYDLMRLPCGGVAAFDVESGNSYRCMTCLATVGSSSMPKHCQDEAQKWLNWEALGGNPWEFYD